MIVKIIRKYCTYWLYKKRKEPVDDNRLIRTSKSSWNFLALSWYMSNGVCRFNTADCNQKSIVYIPGSSYIRKQPTSKFLIRSQPVYTEVTISEGCPYRRILLSHHQIIETILKYSSYIYVFFSKPGILGAIKSQVNIFMAKQFCTSATHLWKSNPHTSFQFSYVGGCAYFPSTPDLKFPHLINNELKKFFENIKLILHGH